VQRLHEAGRSAPARAAAFEWARTMAEAAHGA